jgi:chromosome segregation ATPase
MSAERDLLDCVHEIAEAVKTARAEADDMAQATRTQVARLALQEAAADIINRGSFLAFADQLASAATVVKAAREAEAVAAEHRRQVDTLRDAIDRLNAEHAEQQAALDALPDVHGDLEQARADLADQQRQLADVQAQRAEADAHLAELQHEVSERTAELQRVEARLAALRRSLAA